MNRNELLHTTVWKNFTDKTVSRWMLKVCTKFTSYMIPFVQSSKGQKCSLMIEVSMVITFKDRKEHKKFWVTSQCSVFKFGRWLQEDICYVNMCYQAVPLRFCIFIACILYINPLCFKIKHLYFWKEFKCHVSCNESKFFEL